MMVIPENLPLEVAPLAWMLGSWRGWGMMTSPDGDRPVIETVDATVVDTRVQMVTSVFAASTDHDLDPTLDAEAGLAALAEGPLLRRETLDVTVNPSFEMAPAPGEVQQRDLSAVGEDQDGRRVTWVGMSMGPRVQFSSDTIASAHAETPSEPGSNPADKQDDVDSQTPDQLGASMSVTNETDGDSAKPDSAFSQPASATTPAFHLSRLYGLVGGEMMWTQEVVTDAGDMDIDLTGRLARKLSLGLEDVSLSQRQDTK